MKAQLADMEKEAAKLQEVQVKNTHNYCNEKKINSPPSHFLSIFNSLSHSHKYRKKQSKKLA